MIYDVIIVGGGPAGLTAAIYAKRAGLSMILLDPSPMSGGQIVNTYEVDNYPGLPGKSGMELGMAFRQHGEKLGAEYRVESVKSIGVENGYKQVVTRKETYLAKTVILCTGAVNRKLGVAGEKEFTGAGVSYCATCDGAFFRNKVTAVVGGGDVALEDALFLSRFASKVYLIHRRDEFRGAKILQDQVMENPKIEVLYDTVVNEIRGQSQVESLLIYNRKKEESSELPVDGVFIAVGILPNTEKLSNLPAVDDHGYIIAGEDTVTSEPGIFAAGDVRTKQLRQVITAAADGANAITSIQRYLEEHPEL